MKRIIFTILLSAMSIGLFAQVNQFPDGKVSIGMSSAIVPISRLTFQAAGDQYMRSYFYGDYTTMGIRALGNMPYPADGSWGGGLKVNADASSQRGDIGIEVFCGKSATSSSGRAIGIYSGAGNATSGHNYGVVGNVTGSNYGAGILGGANMSYPMVIADGLYAGWFQGNVKVTGTINGVLIGTSDARYKENIQDVVEKDNVLSNIMRLNPVSYNLKQIYTETPDSTSIGGGKASKVGMYDEKSQMFQKMHFGLIAQDLQKIYPNLVYENDNGYLGINYTELIPLLIQSIKDLKKEVDVLSAAFVNTRSTTSNDQLNIPRAVLYQNVPNPFTVKTEIKFELPDKIANAYIMIFNMQGALVKQIQLQRQQQNVTINGSELTAGMYLYSLIVDGKEIDTKRMILTK